MGLVKMMIRKAREERETFKAKAGSRLNSNWPRTLPSISSQQLQPTHRIVKANATPLSLSPPTASAHSPPSRPFPQNIQRHAPPYLPPIR